MQNFTRQEAFVLRYSAEQQTIKLARIDVLVVSGRIDRIDLDAAMGKQ